MSYAQSITIGPEFFVKAFQDYSDRYWAFPREIMQNSMDCGAKRIDVSIIENMDLNLTVVAVANNGEPMTRETLVEKLLSLGSSGKDFQGTVGGFGKAKEILYFAHQHYEIVSGDWRVAGSGAGYDIEAHAPHVHGTRSTVVWKGLHAERLADQFRKFIGLCGAGSKVKFTVNGEAVTPTPGRLTFNRDLDRDGVVWAKVFTTKANPHRVIVRVGGVPMFSRSCDYKHGIVLELTGTSAQRLTSNRDALRYPFCSQFSDFVTQLAVDRLSALSVEKAVYTRFDGAKFRRSGATTAESSPGGVLQGLTAARTENGGAGIDVDVEGRSERPRGVLSHEFFLKNCVRRNVPAEFDPESESFSDHARWLVRAWAGCLLELYDLSANNDLFSVGFLFSEDVVAESENTARDGQVYYLNPCVVGKRRTTRRYKQSNRGAIVATAAHEFIHGALGEHYHGEDFASKLTDVMAQVVNHWRRFARHFA